MSYLKRVDHIMAQQQLDALRQQSIPDERAIALVLWAYSVRKKTL